MFFGHVLNWNMIKALDTCKKTSPKQWYCHIYKWWTKGGGQHSGHFCRTSATAGQRTLSRVCQRGSRRAYHGLGPVMCLMGWEGKEHEWKQPQRIQGTHINTWLQGNICPWRDHRKYILASAPSSWHRGSEILVISLVIEVSFALMQWLLVGSWNVPNEG